MTVENHTAGDSRRNQKARRTEKQMRRRHHQMDRAGPRRNHETDHGPTSMDPSVRDVYILWCPNGRLDQGIVSE